MTEKAIQTLIGVEAGILGNEKKALFLYAPYFMAKKYSPAADILLFHIKDNDHLINARLAVTAGIVLELAERKDEAKLWYGRAIQLGAEKDPMMEKLFK